jgi:hypothetical protein
LLHPTRNGLFHVGIGLHGFAHAHISLLLINQRISGFAIKRLRGWTKGGLLQSRTTEGDRVFELFPLRNDFVKAFRNLPVASTLTIENIETAMRYKLLGKSGLRVSELCLGTMTFGEAWKDWHLATSKEESRKIFDGFAEAGGNFIDTANKYNEGASESLLGEFIESGTTSSSPQNTRSSRARVIPTRAAITARTWPAPLRLASRGSRLTTSTSIGFMPGIS